MLYICAYLIYIYIGINNLFIHIYTYMYIYICIHMYVYISVLKEYENSPNKRCVFCFTFIV